MRKAGMVNNPEVSKAFKLRYFEPVKGAPADTMLPKRSTKNAAGYDFYAPHDFIIPAGGASDLICFNVKAHMIHSDYLQLKIRSGLSVKHDIMLACSGVIDADYVDNPDNLLECDAYLSYMIGISRFMLWSSEIRVSVAVTP